LGTLRFGIRAKSIKNSARVNAELSPAELKNMLKKSQAANVTYQAYIVALEAELGVWRSGGHVDQGDWATPDKATSGGTTIKRPTSTTPSTPGRSMTPVIPALQDLRGDLDSRPQTPTVVGLDKDERDDFLRRENELSDLLAEKVCFYGSSEYFCQPFQQETALRTQQKLVAEIKEELAFLKEQEASTSRENKAMSSQLNELRLQLERLGYDSKESAIAMDILKEQNTDLANDLEELRKTIAELRLTQKDASTEDKEKKKAEKMAMMMAKFDTVGSFAIASGLSLLTRVLARSVFREGRSASGYSC
jgi:kinesin family protein 5